MTLRLLCVGDIHLGRRPSRLPEDTQGVDVRELTPVAAWRRAVELALEERVDAVLLAGDVVESEGDLFEAYGPLEAGVERLLGDGIAVVGVAGNHDVEALPKLARRIHGFRLLGREGRWERAELDTRGGRIDVWGWSFPQRVVTQNPLDDLPPIERGDVPVVGLLHCEVDATGGPYAPVPRRRFDEVGGDAWLLGHVHAPDPLAAPRPVGYLGSLVGLDPGEPGRHGPWLVTFDASRNVGLRQVPLAPIRWEREVVDVAALTGHESMADSLLTAALDALARIRARIETPSELRAVGCRLVMRGRTPFHRALRQVLATSDAARLTHSADGVLYFVERIVDDAAAELDLESLATGDDPPALLARRMIQLRDGAPEAEEVLARARRELEAVCDQPARWGRLDPLEDGRPDARELLLRAGRTALEELLAQREPAATGGGAP